MTSPSEQSIPPKNQLYNLYSNESSLRHQQQLGELSAALEREGFLPANTSLLSIPDFYEDVSAQASPAHRIIGINERLWSSTPPEIMKFIALHEATHLQLGSEVSRQPQQNFPDILKFFHDQIVPDWLEGKVTFRADEAYLDYKSWSGLYDNWGGPMAVKLAPAKQAVNRYFEQLSKGMVSEMGGRLLSQSYDFVGVEDEVAAETAKDPAEMYRQDPELFTRAVLTGFELADYLQNAYRDAASHNFGYSLWEWEEGYCNYAAAKLSGVAPSRAGQFASQDAGKIHLAEELLAKLPHDFDVRQVTSYSALASLFDKR